MNATTRFEIGMDYEIIDSSKTRYFAQKAPLVTCTAYNGTTASFVSENGVKYEGLKVYMNTRFNKDIESVTLYMREMVETSHEYFENVYYTLRADMTGKRLREDIEINTCNHINRDIKSSLHAKCDRMNDDNRTIFKMTLESGRKYVGFAVGKQYKAIELCDKRVGKPRNTGLGWGHLESKEVIAECLCINGETASFLIVDENPRVMDFDLSWTRHYNVRIGTARPVEWKDIDIDSRELMPIIKDCILITASGLIE